jgi:hypothetical protein
MIGASSDWKSFLRKHWEVAAVFVAGVVLAFVGMVYVFWWFAGDAQSTGLVPSSLGLWSMHHLIWFAIYLILWELLIIGIPVAIAGVLVWQWWKRLPAEEIPVLEETVENVPWRWRRGIFLLRRLLRQSLH